MPRTIRCINCAVKLNLPENVASRRLKCPKCGARFQATESDLSAASTMPGISDARFDSLSGLVPVPKDLPDSGLVPVPKDLPEGPLPIAAGDLRETFELPMMTEADTSGGSRPAREVADALALFETKATAKRLRGAEARAQNRRCPTCGRVVAAGTSLCHGCGLDLDTGTRIDLDYDLVQAPPPPDESIPIDIAAVGGTCLLAGAALGIFALTQWKEWLDGMEFLALVCAFAVYAAVMLLRLKTMKLLLVALTLGALIDVVALICLPAYNAYADRDPQQQQISMDDPDKEDIVIPSVVERIDTNKITWGIALLCIYAALSVYLLSPRVRRYMGRKQEPEALPPPLI